MRAYLLLLLLIFLMLPTTAVLSGADERLSFRPQLIDEPVLIFGERRAPLSGELRLDSESSDLPEFGILQGRSRYWAEDGHLEVVVRTSRDAPHRLAGRILGEAGDVLARFDPLELPGHRFGIFPQLPVALLQGGHGVLELELLSADGYRVNEWAGEFSVEQYSAGEQEAVIPIRIDNPDSLQAKGIPFTVGVPFPRGGLNSLDDLGLYVVYDGGRNAIPFQVNEIGRWSRYGSIKWVHVDFVLELDGRSIELELEYGGSMSRVVGEAIHVDGNGAFPDIDLGRIVLGDGLSVAGAGKILAPEALRGAFVKHENGSVYRMDPRAAIEVEEQGSEKVVVRTEDYFRDESGDRFCRYLVRYVLHRDSSLMRVVYTWTYTGESSVDRIASMGWRLPTAGGSSAIGILEPEGAGLRWGRGLSLVQYDYEHFESIGEDGEVQSSVGRAPGISAVRVGPQHLYFGVRDFWQNYPSELELLPDGGVGFYNWPRRNRPNGHTFDKKWETAIGEPAGSASAARYQMEADDTLTRSEWTLNILQHRFAHEGEVLNFKLPQALKQKPLNWQHIDSIEAQGTSRTEEFWVYLPQAEAEQRDIVGVLQGLNDGTLRATVDPRWIASSDVFNEIHPRDHERFPAVEDAYELAALSWANITERLGMYGMWVYGDLPLWEPHLSILTPSLRRSFQKQHLGWPYSWIPYARSGDSRLLRSARANTQRIIDTGYCHYVSDALAGDRKEGYLGIGPTIWRNSNGIHIWGNANAVDFLLDAWHLDANYRARDMVDFLSRIYRADPPQTPRFVRGTNAQLKYCIDHFNATGDPWFLAAAHAIAAGHHTGWSGEFPDWAAIDGDFGKYGGRAWNSGDIEYLRLTGDPEFEEDFYLRRHVPRVVTEWLPTHYNRRHPQFSDKSYAYWLTGDEYFRRRAYHAVLAGTALVGQGKNLPDYYQGYIHRGPSTPYTIFTGYYLRWLPLALAVVAADDVLPDPIATSFMVDPLPAWRSDDDYRTRKTVTFLKQSEYGDFPLRLRAWTGATTPNPIPGDIVVNYRITDVAGAVFLEGEWDYAERTSEAAIQELDLMVRADWPDGVYHLKLRFPGGRAGLALPVAPWNVPEVVEWQAGRESFNSSEGFFWFRLQPDTADFTMMFREQGMALAMIWDPAGNLVWSQGDGAPNSTDAVGRSIHEVTVEVQHDQQDGFWRVTSPGRFRFSDSVIPLLSVSPEKWFDPSVYHDQLRNPQ